MMELDETHEIKCEDCGRPCEGESFVCEECGRTLCFYEIGEDLWDEDSVCAHCEEGERNAIQRCAGQADSAR